MSIFTPKISDDLFFSHRPGFSDLTFLYCIKCHIGRFLHKKNHYFRKEFLDKTIFYSVRTFARIRQHYVYFSKYWGTNAWAVPPPQILGGPSPPRSPPLLLSQNVHENSSDMFAYYFVPVLLNFC